MKTCIGTGFPDKSGFPFHSNRSQGQNEGRWMREERPKAFGRPSHQRGGLPSSIGLPQTASEAILKPNAAESVTPQT